MINQILLSLERFDLCFLVFITSLTEENLSHLIIVSQAVPTE